MLKSWREGVSLTEYSLPMSDVTQAYKSKVNSRQISNQKLLLMPMVFEVQGVSLVILFW